MRREADPGIRNPRLPGGVGADLLGAVSGADHLLAFGGDGALLLRLLDLEEARLEHAHRLRLVLDLAALVLALHDEARRQVGQADGGVGRVDALTARSRGAEAVD